MAQKKVDKGVQIFKKIRDAIDGNAEDSEERLVAKLDKVTLAPQTVAGPVEFLHETIAFDKIVANSVEVAGATIQVSQRVAMKAFGNELTVISPVEEDNNLLLHVPFNTTDATDEIHVPRLGVKEFLTFQPIDTDTFMGNKIIIPTIVGTGTGAITSVLKYKFTIAGVPVRQRTMVTNLSGDIFDIYGTSTDPYLYFTSEAGLTAIEYDSPVPVTPGVLFNSVIESVDGSPLNIMGVNGGPIFSPWASIEFQDFESTPLAVSDIKDLLFGTESQYDYDDTENITASNVFQTKLSMVTPALAGGNYYVAWNFALTNGVTNKVSEAQVTIDGLEVGLCEFRSKPADNYSCISGFIEMPLSTAEHTINIEYRAISGAAKIKAARLRIYRAS